MSMNRIASKIPEDLRETYRRARAWLLSIGLDGGAAHAISPEERMASRAVAVIVAIHDAPDVTERCLLSLERNGGDAEVILVDDGSKQERTRRIIDHLSARNGWEVARHKSAQGHSRACERGAEKAKRDYLCFLNSDTVVTPFSWDGMVKVLRNDPGVGVIGPATSRTSTAQVVRRADLCRLYWSDGQIDDFASRYTTRHKGLGPVEMDYVGGFAFLVTRSAWKDSGGFDPKLSAYGNEVELCRRLKKKGYRTVWTKGSYVHHFGESSFRQHFTSAELHSQRVAAKRFIDSQSR